ncbi:D-arginine dehydrogenase [Actinokineospora alba]|uniref:D-arginine dehydrogenase n=1 Tax=Actinokineospora alba TaxID=504798 RepID=A0A1H0JZ71_9PSEU|nr:FAD-binding oxidoreductase [Actinokineospora alba]TDP68111.1 D-arginine dehydrogenase [Actinokineospora alba]SDH92473.1 D-arginine dehydrogenase [Actinokineospora alba]SDO48809.1 D-arginine dehydrogenase [Actinokineospora alba]
MTTVVIGGGIAGVSVAAELAVSRDVVLVEAEPMLARHTTGRSAAVYLPSYGGPVIRALTAASRTRFAPELLSPRPMLWVSTDEDGDQHVRDTLAAGTAEPITVAQARELCSALRPDAFRSIAIDTGTMDIDAMGLHQHYVRELKARGGEIRMGAPVTALTRDGGGWRISLGEDELHADEVVNAAGAWADHVAALAGIPSIGLTPLKRTIAIAVGKPVDPAWPLVADAADRFYFRPEGEGVLLSPADETPSEPCDAKPDDLDVALALERVNEVTTLGLRSVRTAWAGLRSFTPGRTPVVGAAPGHPGFHFFAGQGGYGIQMAPALAAAGAAVILGAAIPADIAVTAQDLRSPQWTA